MTLFLNRTDFERTCRHVGVLDIAFDAERGEYRNPATQQAYLVWDSLAQTRNARAQPVAWLLRRRGKDQGISVTRPYTSVSPEQWKQKAATGWEQPLALWPAMPVTGPSEDAILSERQRQLRVKGYHPERDRRYQDDELLRAAAAYALSWLAPSQARAMWPWPNVPMKPETRLRAIEKACALLIAEHERQLAAPETPQ